MTTIDHWNDAESEPLAWDLCRLGGEALPGVARVSVRIASDLDIKKPDGARSVRTTRGRCRRYRRS